jgi:Tol biopolymer transport system component
MGFTRDGSFYYTVWSGKLSNVYTATIDVQAGEVFTKPANITRHRAGENTFVGWSPDGKYLAYLSRPYVGPRAISTTIVIRNVETAEEREINPKIRLVHATGGRWSPDGRSLIAVGREKGQGIYRIDVQSGEVTPLVGPGRQEPVCPVWSSDGKAIYYVQRADEPERILVRDLQTAREREVARGATGAPWLGIALSPDGKHLAFFAGEAKQSFVLRTVPVGGGETRELFRVQQPEFTRGAPAWSPDGRQLLVIDRSADQKTHTLWRVSAEDGKAQKFDLAIRRLSHVHMHPDGKQIAFSAHSAQSAKSEFWVMENFLPELNDRQ